MKCLAAVILVAAAASPVSAAVSGYWDSSKVIHAILGNDRVADALKQQPVESIVRTEDGYRISSRDCRVDIRVGRSTMARPGQANFSLSIGKGRCS